MHNIWTTLNIRKRWVKNNWYGMRMYKVEALKSEMCWGITDHARIKISPENDEFCSMISMNIQLKDFGTVGQIKELTLEHIITVWKKCWPVFRAHELCTQITSLIKFICMRAIPLYHRNLWDLTHRQNNVNKNMREMRRRTSSEVSILFKCNWIINNKK